MKAKLTIGLDNKMKILILGAVHKLPTMRVTSGSQAVLMIRV